MKKATFPLQQNKIELCCGLLATFTLNNESPFLTLWVNFWTLHFIFYGGLVNVKDAFCLEPIVIEGIHIQSRWSGRRWSDPILSQWLRCQVVLGLCDVGSGFGCRGKNTLNIFHLLFLKRTVIVNWLQVFMSRYLVGWNSTVLQFLNWSFSATVVSFAWNIRRLSHVFHDTVLKLFHSHWLYFGPVFCLPLMHEFLS